MSLKRFIILLVMIEFVKNSYGMDYFSKQVQERVDFNRSETIRFDPPIKIKTKESNVISVSFVDVYPCINSEDVYIIANIRKIKSFIDVHMHEREDFFEAQKVISNPKDFIEISSINFQNGVGFYTNSMLLFLGRWDVFLSQNPFPKAGLSIDDQNRLILERLLQLGISTRQ